MFEAAVEGGGRIGLLLVLIGVLSSVVSVYYYLRVAYVMFTGELSVGRAHQRSPLVNVVLILAAAAVVQMGIAPSTVNAIAHRVGALPPADQHDRPPDDQQHRRDLSQREATPNARMSLRSASKITRPIEVATMIVQNTCPSKRRRAATRRVPRG